MIRFKKAIAVALILVLSCNNLAYSAKASTNKQLLASNIDAYYEVRPNGELWNWGNMFGYRKIMNNVKAVIVDKFYLDVTEDNYAAAIKNDNSLWIWDQYYFKFSTIADEYRFPKKIIENISNADIGQNTIVAVSTDGTLWAWGNNEKRLIAGEASWIDTPTKIASNVASAQTNSDCIMYVKTDGSLWQIGNNMMNTNDLFTKHTRIMKEVSDVLLTYDAVFVIKEDGSLWGWGDNSCGSLSGSRTVERYNKPVHILDDVAMVSSSGIHTLAVKKDGSLWGWGDNSFYQLAQKEMRNEEDIVIDLPSIKYVYEPLLIMEGVNVASAAYNSSVIIKTDGSLWAWSVASNYLFEGSIDPDGFPHYATPEMIRPLAAEMIVAAKPAEKPMEASTSFATTHWQKTKTK